MRCLCTDSWQGKGPCRPCQRPSLGPVLMAFLGLLWTEAFTLCCQTRKYWLPRQEPMSCFLCSEFNVFSFTQTVNYSLYVPFTRTFPLKYKVWPFMLRKSGASLSILRGGEAGKRPSSWQAALALARSNALGQNLC